MTLSTIAISRTTQRFALSVGAALCFVSYALSADSAYVSHYANSGSSPALGISQYQNSDVAAAYQYGAANGTSSYLQSSDEAELGGGSERSNGVLFSTRERYSSKNANAPLAQEEIQSKYASEAEPDYLAYPVGSDAYFDAKTADFRNRNAAEADELLASSGNGSTRRTKSKGLFGYAVETNARDGDTFTERWIEPDVPSEGWVAQLLPEGLMYHSYLAGRKEARLQSVIDYAEGYGTLWDITLGGKAPIWRFGTTDKVQPEGWELELEGAALLRLDWERDRNLAATDYRAGVPLVYGTKRWQFKTGYYHVSSHLGDNYLLDHFRKKVHYVRDALMFGYSFTPVDDVRMYVEYDWAFHVGQTTEPSEFQFGIEYSPLFDESMTNWVGRPFLAAHAHLYQELDFGGYWATQLGMQWRSPSNSLMRVGAEYYQGCDDEYQFHTSFQRKYGFGFWYDF